MNNKKSDRSETTRIAFFWDESFLWGLVAYDTFTKLGINLNLVTSSDIRSGCLENHYDILFVPGGWASNKSKALGESGKDKIRDFIDRGGSYLGFCGGAGLALNHRDGLSLMPVSRKPTSDRLPSLSGKIRLVHTITDHPVWTGISNNTAFHVWWPGQFSIQETDNVNVLATYGDPENGAFVADIPVYPAMDWDMWEQSYKTNLNPGRIAGEPAIIEGIYGKGKVLLSYPHLETPGDSPGNKVLINIFNYLSDKKECLPRPRNINSIRNSRIIVHGKTSSKLVKLAKDLEGAASDLILFGQQNFLWHWRNSWIIQWRRGVRGIEYLTLYSMLNRLGRLVRTIDGVDPDKLSDELIALTDLCLPFFDNAKKLLSLERYAMVNGSITPLESDNDIICYLRGELFSNTKSFGGYYKQIIDRIDAILYPLLQKQLELFLE